MRASAAKYKIGLLSLQFDELTALAKPLDQTLTTCCSMRRGGFGDV
jgi:hypothetical protein